jgi:pimeloyl-ACP methyl ester carboxylesterase
MIEGLYAENPRRAVSAFMNGAAGPTWRDDINALIPGASEQGSGDGKTLVELDLPFTFEYAFGEDLAGKISQPVLFITGTRAGRRIEVVRMLAPNLEEVTIPGVNHSLQMVAPGLIAEVVAPFLAQHPM